MGVLVSQRNQLSISLRWPGHGLKCRESNAFISLDWISVISAPFIWDVMLTDQ